MITDAVKLATQTLFRFIVPFPLQFDFLSWFSLFGDLDRWRTVSLELTTAGAAAGS